MAEQMDQRRIVVGVDGSPTSRQALRWAVGQAALTGATVEAVHALEIPVTDGWAPMFDLVEHLSKAAEHMLAGAVAETARAHPTVVVRARVIEGHPATVLLSAAEGADLLVLGSRGHGGFVGALLGSVSQHCAHHATCPVVIIRDRQA
jgi:nucleotide-binding universal stress UspA family protein